MAESESEQLLFALERSGFRLTRSNAAHLEFSKMYVDDAGSVGRAVVLLSRGRLDLTGDLRARLSGFVVEVQHRLDPTEEAVGRAPPVMQEDLFRVLRDLRMPADLPHVVCTCCGARVQTFSKAERCLACEGAADAT